MSEAVGRSWTDFWGELLHLRCHHDNPQRWSAREARAAQLVELGVVRAGRRVVDLGCGDGLLDICLARHGARVVAVDRLATVLAAARLKPDGALVDFRAADYTSLELAPRSCDTVLWFDCLGLLEAAAEQRLWLRLRGWLRPGGVFALDAPPASGEDAEGSSEQLLDEGRLTIHWRYTAADRMLWIQPRFEPLDGPVVVLEDPYRADGPRQGVWRYSPTANELQSALAAAGFEAAPVAVEWRERGQVLWLARVDGK